MQHNLFVIQQFWQAGCIPLRWVQKIFQILEMINKLPHDSTTKLTNLKKIVISFEMERLQALKKEEVLISNLIMNSCLVGTFIFQTKNYFFLCISLHRDHPFKTSVFFKGRVAKISQICRWIVVKKTADGKGVGVKNHENLPTS